MTEALTTPREDGSGDQAHASAPTERVWVLRKHPRVSLREAHAIVEVNHARGAALASCGLELGPTEIGDVPAGGCMPCVRCVAAT